MLGSAIVYSGLAIATAGVILAIRPIERLHVTSRSQGRAIVGMGVLIAGFGFIAPTSEKRIDLVDKRLDEFVPVWQFNERHAIDIDASPERVFAAIKSVRADEISLFQTLTWIRRGGRHNQYCPRLEDGVAAIAPRLKAGSRPNPTRRRLSGIV